MHGGAKTLSVISSDDCTALLRQWREHPRLVVLHDPGTLIILQEKTAGILQEIIQAFSINIVDKTEWDRQKHLLGERIYRLGKA